jgi:GDPmannose 4,6-dehydratase
MEKKRALISGINGMDGSYLADFLLKKNYEVFGIERNYTPKSRHNLEHIIGKINFLRGDLTDQDSLLRCINDSEPNEIYNLAASSFIGDSWNSPNDMSNITGMGVLRMLEAIRYSNQKNIKFYQASSSEMFGTLYENPCKETSPFFPKSPYGVAKLFGHWMTNNYRESYNMFNCCGILFNHEGERRGMEFVTRKITNGVAKIYLGLSDNIILGNINSFRDWGYAPDYVEGMWMMLQQEQPDDYVLSTGIIRSIEELLEEAFKVVGIIDWRKYVITDDKFFRPKEIDFLKGDYSKAKKKLGWEPKTSFPDMIKKMVLNDLNIINNKI